MTKTSKLLLFTAMGILVVFVASWFLLLGPKRAEANDIRQQDQAAQDQINQLASQLVELRAEAKNVPAQRAKLNVLGKQIPGDPALPNLIRNLHARANDTDIELVALKPSAPVPYGTADGSSTTGGSDGLQTVPLEVDVSGSYSQLKMFIADLEDLQRSFMVTGFDIKGPDGGATPASTTAGPIIGKGPLTVTINGEVFTAPEASPPPVPTNPDAAK